MREQMAPRFLGEAGQPVPNEFGGVTITYNGSKPGMLAKVTIVMGANGRPVAQPIVELADVLEGQ